MSLSFQQWLSFSSRCLVKHRISTWWCLWLAEGWVGLAGWLCKSGTAVPSLGSACSALVGRLWVCAQQAEAGMVPAGMQIWIQVNLQALKRCVVAKHGMCEYFRNIFILDWSFYMTVRLYHTDLLLNNFRCCCSKMSWGSSILDIEKLKVLLLDVAETPQCEIISEGTGTEGLLEDCVVARRGLWNAKPETSLGQPIVRFPPFTSSQSQSI